MKYFFYILVLFFYSHLYAVSPYTSKVDSLLKIMSLDEKIGQMNQYTGSFLATGPLSDDSTIVEQLKAGRVGSMLNIIGTKNTRMMQEIALQSRLKIPLIFGLDVVHGYKTTFPIPLGEAASFDFSLAEFSARVAATEAASAGTHWTFAPMIDVSRDARWGRVMEGGGEDPWMTTQIAKAKVKGYQGTDLKAKNTIMACAKHFVAYGAPIAGKEYNTVDISLQTLHNVYLPPFKAAAKMGIGSFMNSFNDLNGIPCTGNQYILRELLKGNWGFEGFVVSDWGSVAEMVPHGFVNDQNEAARAALLAGCDMDMESRSYTKHLKKLVETGKVSVALVDEAVKRILIKKYELGLFDDPFAYCDEALEKRTLLSPENRLAARDVAKKSIVLLKNSGTILPISKTAKSILLVGPLMKSKEDMLGFWACEKDIASAVTPFEAFTKNLTQTKVDYSEGYSFSGNQLINLKETIKKAAKSELIVVAIGERWNESGEAKSKGNIAVPAMQQTLVTELAKTGKPIILLVMGGRPLLFNEAAESASAILVTWWLGSEAGNAIFDVLVGNYNPSGRLPMTFPKYMGQIPIYYNYNNTGRPEQKNRPFSSQYIDIDSQPAYPFGFGLSYTTFEYSNLKLNHYFARTNETTQVSVTVKNTGKVSGKEIVQLYIRDLVASSTRPVKELKGIENVFLKPGECKEVSFLLSPDELGFWGNDLTYRVEEGVFEIMAGGNPNQLLKSWLTLKNE